MTQDHTKHDEALREAVYTIARKWETTGIDFKADWAALLLTAMRDPRVQAGVADAIRRRLAEECLTIEEAEDVLMPIDSLIGQIERGEITLEIPEPEKP